MADEDWTPSQIAKLCENMTDKFLRQDPALEIERLARYVRILALYTDAMLRFGVEGREETAAAIERIRQQLEVINDRI